ncbi:hypothetical protein IMZ29_01025 [Achromobacter sp. GG226]|uniref:hypothetical protein n=1 Tax=Verticiella alkaliphila TaxID=2779529 RepID=UPI001C0C58EB|nr:hypothetical protein [Verticiella sp. GG226]MBU4609186.1 hypothetical protein [Verticiella sp. GG226]
MQHQPAAAEDAARASILPGSVVQLSPTTGNPAFAACFMVITDVMPWGAMGYVRVPGGGDAYYRAKHEDMTLIGRAEWMREDET